MATNKSIDAGATFVQANGKSVLTFTASAIAGQVRAHRGNSPVILTGYSVGSQAALGGTHGVLTVLSWYSISVQGVLTW